MPTDRSTDTASDRELSADLYRVLAVIGPLMAGPLRKYRAVHTKTVAQAMLVCSERAEPGVHIVESDVIQDIGA